MPDTETVAMWAGTPMMSASSVTKQSASDAHAAPNTPFVPSTPPLDTHDPSPPPGSEDSVTSPFNPEAMHNDADAHATCWSWRPPAGCCNTHALAPPVGSIEVVKPDPPTIAQNDIDGHEMLESPA
jgi:hypothetical protein